MKPITDKNRLSIVRPDIAAEWNYEKNGNLTPDKISYGSERKVWWKCKKCGYEWEAVVYSRNDGNGCPSCGKKKQTESHRNNQIKNKGSLATNRPDIADEWNYEKNGDLLPEQITTGYNHSVWWRCKKCGNEFKASPNNRVNKSSRCPKCAFRYHTSLAEQTLYFYIKKVYDDAINSYKSSELGRFEIDIYIPSIQIGIEYDGEKWHGKEKTNKDLRKYKVCKKNGITLIRIKELGPNVSDSDLSTETCDYVIAHNSKDINGFDDVLKKLNKVFPLKIKYDIEKDRNSIMTMFYKKIEGCSLTSQMPELVKEWNYEKNKNLSPDMFTCGSKAKVWWKCSICGKEWQEVINVRTNNRFHLFGCATCNRIKGAQKRREGFIQNNGSLAENYPELISEWCFDKNAPLTPNDVTSKSHIKYWWRCNICGHEWESSIANRTKGQGCPKCGRKSTTEASKTCVLNIDTGEIFDSLKSAAESINKSYGTVSSCCRGKTKTAGGYHWKYLDE